MEKLFERHDAYLVNVPMGYIREMMNQIDQDFPLFIILHRLQKLMLLPIVFFYFFFPLLNKSECEPVR